MTKDERKVSLAVGRRRYAQLRGRRAKGRFLDEFCETSGLDRKHVIKRMSGRRGPDARRGAPRRFSAEARRLLARIWRLSDKLCGKLLVAVLPEYVRSLRRRGPIDEAAAAEVLRMSASTVDRALRHAKPKGGVSRRRSGSLAEHRREVPLKVDTWPAEAARTPGWLEADTVAHSGGDMSGSFVWSLTLTDVASQWTEVGCVWNKGAEGVCAMLRELLARMPAEPLGINTDNGSEFLNHHVARHFRDLLPSVARTRSRSSVKNDNAHAEQKNGVAVRRLFGYGRIDEPGLVGAMSAVAADASLWRNLHVPNSRLLSKRREGSRWIKRHEKHPRTPAQRLLEDPSIAPELKARIRALLAAHDPLDLKDRVDAGLAQLARLMAQTPPDRPATPDHAPPAPRRRAKPPGTQHACPDARRAGGPRPSQDHRPQGPQRPLEPC
jgi:hypothetical protein